ncbi:MULTISPECIES: AAA family ATPase [unclassified Methylobacterium]|uniref:AAA family ATPase n=1 Tax=unclassified Methylobacterium TaxID=2615210 RepID=UPI0036F51F70
MARSVEPSDLRIALHSSRGAEASVRRLVTVVGRRLQKTHTSVDPKLEVLAGYGAALEWGLGTASDLSAYARGELDWEDCERGVLLVGRPGTGKTLFAGAMARQAGIPIVAGSLAEWQSVGEAHLGTTLKAMRGFFEAAAMAAPCIALIDELDSFGDRREFQDRNRQYASQVVNGLLECLDGQSGRAGVFLVGTTNIPERIDPAIIRSGRFDRRMRLELPSIVGLAAILRHHLGHDLADADLDQAARNAFGCTGADCAAWVRRARGRARRAERSIELPDLMAEIGVNNSGIHSGVERRAAIHESGHALVASSLGIAIERISLHSAEDEASGWIRFNPSGESTAEAMRDMLTVALAGRAAEILVFGTPSASAAADLRMATSICRNMHCRWGLGTRLSVCPIDHQSRGIDMAVERALQSAMKRASRQLSTLRMDLHRLAEALLERRLLEAAEIALLIPTGRHRTGGTATTRAKMRSGPRSKVSQVGFIEAVHDKMEIRS